MSSTHWNEVLGLHVKKRKSILKSPWHSQNNLRWCSCNFIKIEPLGKEHIEKEIVLKVNLKTETCLQGNQVLLADIMTTLPSSADGTLSEKSESTSLSSHFSLFHSRSSEGKCHPKQSASIIMCDCASWTMSTGAAGSLWSYLADISPVITYQKITLAMKISGDNPKDLICIIR